MSSFEMLQHLSAASLVSIVITFGAGFAVALVALGFRFLRRGPARFWLAPALVSAALVPIVVGAGLSARGLVRVGDMVALVGVGSGAAVKAGMLEAQLPLLAGLLATAAVSVVVLLLLAIGGRPRGTPPAGGWHRGSLLAGALLLAVGLLALLEIAAAFLTGSGAASASRLAQLVAWASVVLALSACAAAVILAVRAPGGPAPGFMRALALGAPTVVGVIALAAVVGGTAVVHGSLRALTEVGASDAADGTLPAPYAADPAALEPSAPPPPPPRAVRGRGSAPSSRAGAIPETTPGRTASSAQRVVRVGGSIKEPRKIRNVSPVYPDIARQARVQGVVILECTIDTQGRVSGVKILRGIPLLDQAAVAAVEQWVYEPTVLDGVPVVVVMTITVNFKLG